MTTDKDNNDIKQIKGLLTVLVGIIGAVLIAYGAGAFNDREVRIIPIETTTTSTP
jgi:hypothetical protein